MLAEVVRPVYASGECEIDLARRELRILGSPVPVGGRAFEIIEVLAESAGELVTKNELMDRIWPGAIVLENTLHVHTAAVRKALGPHRKLLKTESGRGYRLLDDWSIRRQDTARPPVGLQHIRTSGETPGSNLPLTVTRLVGRSAAVQRIQDLVSAYRVVTLTGPGGIGKTTLAIKVGRRILGEFSDGGWLVELASLSDPALVPPTVAHILGLKLGAAEISAESVARAVGGQHLLLVLDNCEHVIDAVATLVEVFVRLCPRTTILATSREILRIEGEHIYRVPPLEVPAADATESDHILDHSAVELFIARAKVLDADFSSHTHHLPAIATICRHLDGIPLAIEFAASRAATLGIDHVAAGLHDRFALLTSGRRTAVPRHRTLRAMLDWSYELLPEPERLLFCRLAIFSGGFTLDAAAAVMPDSGLDPSGVLDGIANLVTKSLVALDQRSASARWYLLETVRAYALEKLALHDQLDTVARRHVLHYRDRFAPPETGSETRLTNENLISRTREIDNVRAALDWSFSPVGDTSLGVDLTAAYALVWLHHALHSECRERCERALPSLEPGTEQNRRLQMQLQLALASALYASAGGSPQARTLASEALEIADSLDDFDTRAWALMVLSAMYANNQKFGAAWTAVNRLEQIAQQSQDPAIVAIADRRKGYVLFAQGRFHEAQQNFERALRVRFATDDPQPAFWFFPVHYPSIARAMLSLILWPQGFADRARNEANASLDELGAAAPLLSICQNLAFGICRAATMTGELATADRAIARLIQIAAQLDSPFWQTVGRLLEGKLMVERREFADALTTLRGAFAACAQTGHYYSAIEFQGALAEALAGLEQFDAALDAVDDAITSARQPDAEVWFLPELLRIKGEVLLQQDAGRSALAEDCFNQAAEMAHEQGALFWELRIALSLARLRVSQGRNDDARQMLAPVYDRFTEGFETADMRAAHAMLDTLPLV